MHAHCYKRMQHLQPIPVFLHETSGADRGLICGYEIERGASPREILADAMIAALERDDSITWLHFNLSDARARRWLLNAPFLPVPLREVLEEHDESRRIEAVGGGLLLVIGDFTYEDASDPSEVATLWCFAGPRLLITARLHPIKSADKLRLQLRSPR